MSAADLAPGPITEFLAADHRGIEALLEDATAAPGRIDPTRFEAFRARLLRHIAIEEKVLLPAVRRARGGQPHPLAGRLRLDHGAIAALLVPTPTPDGVRTLRALLEAHDAIEEGADGVYEGCDRLLAAEAGSILEALRAYPPVRTAPHQDGPLVERHIVDALARAGRQSMLSS